MLINSCYEKLKIQQYLVHYYHSVVFEEFYRMIVMDYLR